MTFWNILMHKCHTGQQIINRIIWVIAPWLISGAIKPGLTGWPLAATGVSTRLGPLLTLNSFRYSKTKTRFPDNIKCLYKHIQRGLAITSLQRQVIVSRKKKNQIQPNPQTLKQVKKTKQTRVTSRLLSRVGLGLKEELLQPWVTHNSREQRQVALGGWHSQGQSSARSGVTEAALPAPQLA